MLLELALISAKLLQQIHAATGNLGDTTCLWRIGQVVNELSKITVAVISYGNY